MTAQRIIQNRINAQEALDALTYGIRSVELSGSAWGASAAHVEQIETACEVAGWRLGRTYGVQRDGGTLRLLKLAKKAVAEDLREIKAKLKASVGGVRQTRLALGAA